MYFNSFPVIPYDNEGNGNLKDVTNLLRRVAIRSKVSTNTAMFDTYDIKEGDTPEILADKFYDDPELHWVILLNDKYTNPSGIHHYEIAQTSGDTTTKIEVNDLVTYPNATPITNFQYEERLEDSKRSIRLLDPKYVPDFVDEFKTKIKESVI